ncbi:hypothetical protein TVAG_453940 [Trichomonas vaginalis G3]|uniref:RRM domain-containing protein n=1 Tax=Trichomonas vaginalis (strain ATCC PRA-98 / G3) TaxID=412133 RepID=A2DPX0_TRIV3|nr:RNA-binding protein family [Trichomonas vaginalis G3]EAY17566.1 hypothetical protein TVAG_453940 [Trichomonas vaginalis G3]KAI5520610.1 RNA-binding protein family [Trichomonas vaginalis G3]|eukprot:XP_001329701.1 hypothetical protein [Trichomonas vaginalis G3]
MNDIAYKANTFLRGGWFTSPEEYESMGYTLGMPPGYYAPNHPEIDKLVERIKPFGGIIFPNSMSTKEDPNSKRKVMVLNLPPEMTPQTLNNYITQNLLKRKLITDPNPIDFIDWLPDQFGGYVTFKSQKDAEAAVSIGKSLVYNQREIHIIWPYSLQTEEFSTIEINENQTKNTIYVEFHNEQPNEQKIYQIFEPKYQVSKTFISPGSNYAIVTLSHDEITDMTVFDLQATCGDDVSIRTTFEPPSIDPRTPSDQKLRQTQLYEGPTKLVSVVAPNLLNNPCIADILNSEMTVSSLIQQETEENQIGDETVLCLYNIAKDYILMDPELTNEFLSDITEECQKYGTILDYKIDPMEHQNDYGVVKIRYKTPEEAKRAQLNLAGRRYEGRLVITSVEAAEQI